jgi:hypothetical protein
MHIEILSIAATAPSTGAAGVALAGDSLTIKNASKAAGVRILCAWQTNQATAGFGQIAFPSGHDTTRGFRSGVPATAGNISLMPFGVHMPVQPQELLAVTIAGSATAGDVENLSALVHYTDLPGTTQRLMTAAEVERRMEHLTSVESSIISTAGPSYGTGELINADSDLLLANRDYAVLGASCRTKLHAAWMSGPDLGNLRIGCPCLQEQQLTSQWFMLQSRLHNMRAVPVISAGNKNATTIGCVTDENAGTFLVTWYLALLK